MEEDVIRYLICQEEWSFSLEVVKQIQTLDGTFQFYRSQDPWQKMWISADVFYTWKKQTKLQVAGEKIRYWGKDSSYTLKFNFI